MMLLERSEHTGQVSHRLLFSGDLHVLGGLLSRSRALPGQRHLRTKSRWLPAPGCSWNERLLPQQHQPLRSETPARNLLREPTAAFDPERYQGSFWGTAHTAACLTNHSGGDPERWAPREPHPGPREPRGCQSPLVHPQTPCGLRQIPALWDLISQPTKGGVIPVKQLG